MKNLISANVDAGSVTAIKAAIARKDGSDISAVRSLQESACQIGDDAWEGMLTIAADAAAKAISAANVAASMAQHMLGKDATAADKIIRPLAAFVESYETSPETWLASHTDGVAMSAELAEGLLKTLRLLQSNARMRMSLLQKFNESVETSVESDGIKVVLDTKVSSHTNQPLKPLSKRDLTAQIERAVNFLANNQNGFTIH